MKLSRTTRIATLFAGLFLAFSMVAVDHADARRGGSFGSGQELIAVVSLSIPKGGSKPPESRPKRGQRGGKVGQNGPKTTPKSAKTGSFCTPRAGFFGQNGSNRLGKLQKWTFRTAYSYKP